VLTPPQEAKQVLGDNFEIVLAFSREGPKKVYVQHRLKEYAKEVNALLEKKAYFYVCGDAANMAREVNNVLGQIISTERGIPETKAEEIVKQMRASNQYQVRLRLRLSNWDPLLTLLNRRMCGHKQAGAR
jgi:NADPH-ferrihemoprotein reductase